MNGINGRISFTCHHPSLNERLYHLLVTYTKKVNLTTSHVITIVNQTLQVNTSNASEWDVRTSSEQIEIQGSPVECGGDGFYTFSLITPQKQFNSSLNLTSK